MFETFRLAASVVWRILFAPIWVAWRGYRVLWWAFDDSDTRRAGASASLAPRHAPPPPGDPKQAFDLVDSTPVPLPLPLGPLRGGFAATLLASTCFALLARALVAAGQLSPTMSWTGWAWATLVAAVGSLFFVRHVAREHAKRRPLGRVAQAKATIAGVGRACGVAARGGFAGAARASTFATRAGKNVFKTSAMAWRSPPLAWVRLQGRKVAARVRRVTPGNPKTSPETA